MNIKKAEEITEQVSDTVGNWKKFAKEVEVSTKLLHAIEKTLPNPD